MHTRVCDPIHEIIVCVYCCKRPGLLVRLYTNGPDNIKMAVKTTAVPSTIPDPEDSSGIEDDAIQKKMNDFAFRYYDTVLKIEKAKKSAVERGLGQSHCSFAIRNESTGTGEVTLLWFV